MDQPAPPSPVLPRHLTAERYFALGDEGVLSENDRVELLEGVVVSMAPQHPRHSVAVHTAAEALRAITGPSVVVRIQVPLVLGTQSVPEPDVALVPGPHTAYLESHPTTALLVVEVADSSLGQDRLTKGAIYAAAGIPQYLIVNLRDDQVEVLSNPDTALAVYRERCFVRGGDVIALASLPGATIAVDDLLPRR